MTITADNLPVGFRARQIGVVSASGDNPVVRLEWEESNVGPYLQSEDGTTSTLVTETIMTGYASSDPNSASETFYFTGGTLVVGETRQIDYTATVRGLPNGQKSNPPTTQFSANKILHSDESFYVVNEAPWVKSLENTFEASIAETLIRYAEFQCYGGTQDVLVATGRNYFKVPEGYNNSSLTAINASVVTAGTTGTIDIQVHNVTQAVDMLSTVLTIDSGETGSETAATPVVIDTANDDISTADILRIDIEATQTTKAKGLMVVLKFTKNV